MGETPEPKSQDRDHDAETRFDDWLLVGLTFTGAGIAALFQMYTAGGGVGWIPLNGALFFAVTGGYILVAAVFNLWLPKPPVARIKHHRKVSGAVLVGLVAVAVVVGSKFPREPAKHTTQNIPSRRPTARTTVATAKPRAAPRRSIVAIAMRTQPPAPRPPHKRRALQTRPRSWPPIAGQQNTLLGLIIQTPQAKDGVWLSKIVERVSAKSYDGMPGPNDVNYPAALRQLAINHRVKILGTTNRRYAQFGSSVQFSEDIRFREVPPFAVRLPPQDAALQTAPPPPATHLSFTQKLISPRDPAYPDVLQITIQTDHKINPISIAIVFEHGVLDAKSVLGFGIANSASMQTEPLWKIGISGRKPVAIVKARSTPPMSPENPLIVTIQSRSRISAQSVMEVPFYPR